MRRWFLRALAGAALTLLAVSPAAAQRWPGYGDYGYGSGYDYNRNPYSYPRPPWAQSPSVPVDTLSLYGGYMPNTYYNGAAYALNRAVAFPSGQAFCQTAGSYLYCADLESGPTVLMALQADAANRSGTILRLVSMLETANSEGSFNGVLATRTVGDRAELVGTLRGPVGEEVALDCAGRPGRVVTNLTCR
jgi:hypothetical protein